MKINWHLVANGRPYGKAEVYGSIVQCPWQVEAYFPLWPSVRDLASDTLLGNRVSSEE